MHEFCHRTLQALPGMQPDSCTVARSIDSIFRLRAGNGVMQQHGQPQHKSLADGQSPRLGDKQVRGSHQLMGPVCVAPAMNTMMGSLSHLPDPCQQFFVTSRYNQQLQPVLKSFQLLKCLIQAPQAQAAPHQEHRGQVLQFQLPAKKLPGRQLL